MGAGPRSMALREATNRGSVMGMVFGLDELVSRFMETRKKYFVTVQQLWYACLVWNFRW
jgi:hypothetical protein